MDTTDPTRTVPQAPAPPPISVEVWRKEALERNRLMGVLLVWFMLAGLAAVPLLGGDADAKLGMTAGLIAAIIAYGRQILITRDPRRYDERGIAIAGHVGALSACATVYYFGIFSIAPALMAIGLLVYSLGARFKYSVGIFGVLAGGHVLLAVSILSGVIDDRGLIRGDHLSMREQIIVQTFMVATYIVTYLVARGARRSGIDAVSQLGRAIRQLTQREALLNEARQELDRALQVGGPGPFSSHRLGSYELGPLIGRGGMGEVYEGRHVETGAETAVKLMSVAALADAGYVERFVREIKAVEATDSPHVVRVLEVSDDDAALPYIAMERLRGESLSSLLRRERRLELPDVVVLAEQVCAGLAAARRAGVVHRDLKPANLFRAEQPSGDHMWKVLDFGVSKLASHDTTLTRGHAVGTPAYMAPEQARGESVDHRADIYAIAANLYRAITGRPAYTGQDVAAILYAVVQKMPPRPSDLLELPAGIDDVLAVGLAKDPAQRFATSEELAVALAAAAQGRPLPEIAARARVVSEAHPWAHGR